MAEVKALPDAERAALEKLLAYASSSGYRPNWGSGMRPGASFYSGDTSHFAVYPWAEGGTVSASLGAVNSSKSMGPAKAAQYLAGLKSVPVLAPYVATLDETTLQKYPSIPVAGVLTEPGAVEALCLVLDTLRGEAPQADGVRSKGWAPST